MSTKTLSSGQVMEAAGMTTKTFRILCEQPSIKPKVGSGNHRQFTVMEAVGIVVAQRLRASERGCSLPYSERVITTFASLSEAELLAEFVKGNTFFVFVPMLPETPLLWPKLDDGNTVEPVDVQACYETVKKALENN